MQIVHSTTSFSYVVRRYVWSSRTVRVDKEYRPRLCQGGETTCGCTSGTAMCVPALDEPPLCYEAVKRDFGCCLCHIRLEGIDFTEGRKGRDAKGLVGGEHDLFQL